MHRRNEMHNESPTHQQVSDAIQWLVQFETGDMDELEQHNFELWLSSSRQHQQAWLRLGRANRHFSINASTSAETSLSASIALSSIQQSDIHLAQKRRSLKVITGVAGLGILGWHTQENTYQFAMADLRTGVGKQHNQILDDGSELMLNTQSAVDVDMQARPQINLRYGEMSLISKQVLQLRVGANLFIAEADSELVLSKAGKASSDCQLRVVAGGVNCILATGSSYTVSSGQSLVLNQAGAEMVRSEPFSLSWRQGLLSAERRQLGDFVQQLERYRPGFLSCADEVAKLTFSGSFPINNTDLILDNLCQILPVRQQRISRYWVRLLPA